MSFSIAFIFKKRAILASDKRIIFLDGTFRDGGKILKLSSSIFAAISGNGIVCENLFSFITGLVFKIEDLKAFEKKLTKFKEGFDLVYDRIPDDHKKFLEGSGQLKGVGRFDRELAVFSVNYVPSKNEFETFVSTKPNTLVVSNSDGNLEIEGFTKSLIRLALGLGSLSDEKILKVFKKIYETISNFDKTVSPGGEVLILDMESEERVLIW
jgi:hypothetical protein